MVEAPAAWFSHGNLCDVMVAISKNPGEPGRVKAIKQKRCCTAAGSMEACMKGLCARSCVHELHWASLSFIDLESSRV